MEVRLEHLTKKFPSRDKKKGKDKRVVLVVLTEKGRKAFFHHRDFHRKMIKAIIKDLDEDDMKILIQCLQALDDFFEREGAYN